MLLVETHQLIKRARTLAEGATGGGGASGDLVKTPCKRPPHLFNLCTEKHGAEVLEFLMDNDADFYAEARRLVLELCAELEARL